MTADQAQAQTALASPGRGTSVDISRAALVLGGALVAATFLLISPPVGKTYPGAIPWSDLSVLRPVTDLMSLGGIVSTVRGVEIKDLAFHLAAVAGLVLAGVRMLRIGGRWTGAGRGPAEYAQLLLVAWVLLAFASSLWAGDADLARGQALLYALNLAWAVALGATLERRHLPALLFALVVISAGGAGLCIWYFYERNPFHSPGFPIGNPIQLAAAILPALLTAVILAGQATWETVRAGRTRLLWPAVGALVAMVPLVWCLALTEKRSALVALVVALGLILILLVPRRWRWVAGVIFTVGLMAGGLAWFSRSYLDETMARGATLRFRLYAWRYAAELWQVHPVLGHGAGAYPRLAGELAVRDRALDPAAFMAELVEHAHNELFEVFAEIGLVGGVTLVAGVLATFAAAVRRVDQRRGRSDYWVGLSLASALAALVADAMTGPALRLPGVGPVFYTLMGAIWAAAARSEASPPAPQNPPAGTKPGPALAAALVVFAAAGGAAWVSLRNWTGVLTEQAATTAVEQGRPEEALAAFAHAQPVLLDPVRRVNASLQMLDCRRARAARAVRDWTANPTSAPTTAAWSLAVERARELYADATGLEIRIPSLTRSAATAARAAEWLYALYRPAEPRPAREWVECAHRAWVRQRDRSPYDVETLLALLRYPAPIETHVGLLRDALRFGETQGFWRECLEGLRQQPAFEDTLGRFVAAAGPFTPQTDLDALVASMAPETYRLDAAWRALRDEFAAAAEDAAHAATLYRPMKPRFPNLPSIALAEQAEYVLRGDPNEAPRAVALLKAAIAELPAIQAQKYEDQARPFRNRLALALLVAGDVPEALRVTKAALGDRRDDARLVESRLASLLREAASLGTDPARLDHVHRELCAQFPALCASGE